jgi:lysozyme family protein
MSEFDSAYEHMAKNEGGFTWDPHPTAFGIDRKFWQGWKGWPIVDAVIAKVGRDVHLISVTLRHDPVFMAMVKEFFRVNFWIPNYNRIESQKVATILFDRAVNMGTQQAHRIAQRVLGVLDDGIFGKGSLFAINQMPPAEFCQRFDLACDGFYKALAEKNPEKYGRFKKTWESRA